MGMGDACCGGDMHNNAVRAPACHAAESVGEGACCECIWQVWYMMSCSLSLYDEVFAVVEYDDEVLAVMMGYMTRG